MSETLQLGCCVLVAKGKAVKAVKTLLEEKSWLDKKRVLTEAGARALAAMVEEGAEGGSGVTMAFPLTDACGDAADVRAALAAHAACVLAVGSVEISGKQSPAQKKPAASGAASSGPRREPRYPNPLPSVASTFPRNYGAATDSYWGDAGVDVDAGAGGVRVVDFSDLPPARRERRMRAVLEAGVPALLRGLDLGPCCARWVDRAAVSRATPGMRVGAQVCVHEKVDLAGHRPKGMKANFTFTDMPFAELLERADPTAQSTLPPVAEEGERYYLRSVPEGKMRAGSHFPDMFPGLSADFDLAGLTRLAEGGGASYHSSSLRVTSPGLQLWTHYDMLPNLLAQVIGQKTVTLFPPCAEPYLYVKGTSSRVDDLVSPNREAFPLYAAAEGMRRTLQLRAGEVLFIPPLWFHHTLSGDDSLSLAVNAFYSVATMEPLYQPKDVYGNKDLPVGVQACEAADSAGRSLAVGLPQPYQAFYAVRAAQTLLAAAGLQDTVAPAHLPPGHHPSAAVVPATTGGRRGPTVVVVLTGAFGGIGAHILDGLVRRLREARPDAAALRVVLPTRRRRNRYDAAATALDGAIAEAAAGVPPVAVTVRHGVDLAHREDVNDFVQGLRWELAGAEAEVTLVNNAAVVCADWQWTPDGVETQFAVNVLACYRLARGLRCCGLVRVVNVASSWAADFEAELAAVTYPPPEAPAAAAKYNASRVYRATKQALRTMTVGLSRDAGFAGVVVCACHPGAVHGTAVSQALRLSEKMATHSAEEAARVPVELAVTPPAAANGKMFASRVTEEPPKEDTQWENLVAPLMGMLEELA